MTDAFKLNTKQFPWWLLLISGFLSLIIGILLLTAPAKTVFLLVIALGIYWLVSGILLLIGMFIDHSAWGTKLILGLLGIIVGVMILRSPLSATFKIPSLIALLAGIQGLIVGVVLVMKSFLGGGCGTGILGVLSIVFGAVLMANIASLGSAELLVWVTAIAAIVGGGFLMIQAWRQRAD